MPAKLLNGEALPMLTADVLDGQPMTLPADIRGDWAVLLFYRGHW